MMMEEQEEYVISGGREEGTPTSMNQVRIMNDLKNVSSTFVKKLYDMVENESNEIIGWVADGTAFEVKDPRRLELEVLPRFFRHSRFQSLVRQLNFYAFKKVSKERSSWLYSHRFFQRNRPDLLEKLRRKTNGLSEKRSNAAASQSMDTYEDVSTKRRRAETSKSLSSESSSDDDADNSWSYALKYSNTDGLYRSTSVDSSVLDVSESPARRSRSVPSSPIMPAESDLSLFMFLVNSTHGIQEKTLPQEFNGCSRQKLQQFFSLLHPKSEVSEGSELMSLCSVDSTIMDTSTTVSYDAENHINMEAVLFFCLEHDPWKSSGSLYQLIHHFLSQHTGVTNRVDDYIKALSPPHHNHVMKSGFLNVPKSILVENEITVVRSFSNYALSLFHSVMTMEISENEMNHNDYEDCQNVVRSCAEIWWRFSQMHL